MGTETLLQTPLRDRHIALGGKMVPFAGYEMPVQYSGLKEEHHAVRNAAGMFDVSHMGEFFVRGEGALDLIQRVTSNDASKLVDGKVQYSCMPNADGGIVDDLLVYRITEHEYMLVVNASNMEKDWNWIQQHNTAGVELENTSLDTALIAVQGPKALAIVEELTDLDLQGMKYYTWQQGTVGGHANILVSTTGYTGAGGCEIYMPNAVAGDLWDQLLQAGEPHGMLPAGLGARDTLRLEKGFCLYGNDIDDTTSPIEAGLGWITKFTKDFTNAAALKAQKEAGVTRKLVGFEMLERGIPRHDYPLLDAEGNTIGRVTSGTQSPSLDKAIGMGYVNVEHAAAGSEIFVGIRKKQLKAAVCALPFL